MENNNDQDDGCRKSHGEAESSGVALISSVETVEETETGSGTGTTSISSSLLGTDSEIGIESQISDISSTNILPLYVIPLIDEIAISCTTHIHRHSHPQGFVTLVYFVFCDSY